MCAIRSVIRVKQGGKPHEAHHHHLRPDHHRQFPDGLFLSGLKCPSLYVEPYSSSEGAPIMKKPVRSAKAPATNQGIPSDLVKNEVNGVPEISGTPSRQQVRQDVHRSNVPRQSQRPSERSNQRRSGKP